MALPFSDIRLEHFLAVPLWLKQHEEGCRGGKPLTRIESNKKTELNEAEGISGRVRMRLTTECNVGSVGLGDPAAYLAVREEMLPPIDGINYATHNGSHSAAWRDDKRATKQKVIDNTPNRHMQSARYVCTMKQVSPVGVGSARLTVTLDG